MDKEFVLVSEGIEIMRTKSQEVAINEVKKNNDEWFDYCQRCADNYERPFDNYIELFIETDYDKELQQENQQLKQALNEIRKEILEDLDGLAETKENLGLSMEQEEQMEFDEYLLQIIDKVGDDEK